MTKKTSNRFSPEVRQRAIRMVLDHGGEGSVRTRGTWRREVKAEFSLRRFENGEHTGGTAKVEQAAAAGRDVLVVAGARAKVVAELVIASTEALR